MTDNKHTPGPWKVVNSYTITDSQSIQHIASLVWSREAELDTAYSLRKQDAALIAAAPELLEALEALFRECAMVHMHWGEGDNTQQAKAAIESAQAAIRKAKGEA